MKRVILYFIIVINLFTFQVSTFANAAPNAKSPLNNGEMCPINDRDINVVDEKIEFKNFKKNSVYIEADVTVSYTLINTCDNNKNVELVFPFDNPFNNNNIRIVYNSNPITYEIKENINYFKEFNITRINQPYGWRDPKAIFFSINAISNKKSKLVIKYKQLSGFKGDNFSFLYYLQPAKYWGSYKDLSIYIKLPIYYKLTSDFKFLHKKNFLDNTYTISFDNLPNEDLFFEIHLINEYIVLWGGLITVIFMLVLIIYKKYIKNIKQ